MVSSRWLNLCRNSAEIDRRDRSGVPRHNSIQRISFSKIWFRLYYADIMIISCSVLQHKKPTPYRITFCLSMCHLRSLTVYVSLTVWYLRKLKWIKWLWLFGDAQHSSFINAFKILPFEADKHYNKWKIHNCELIAHEFLRRRFTLCLPNQDNSRSSHPLRTSKYYGKIWKK